MFVQQLSVFIENEPGRLLSFADLLGQEGIDLISLSIADTARFGILRCIVCDHEKALQVIVGAGYAVRTTQVLAVEVPDVPGGMAQVLRCLSEAGVSVEYLYSSVRSAGRNAMLIFQVDDPVRGAQALSAAGIRMIEQEQIRTL